MQVGMRATPKRSSDEARAKGGRPKGSVSLTREIEEKILALIRAGAWGYAAAEAAGISARTYYEWLARGEGRSARGSTPKLKVFARRVRQAEAEARIVAEADVFRTRPALWLSRRVRSKPGREGWTTPVGDGEGPSFSLDFKDYQDPQVRAELYRVHELMLQIEPEFVIPSCPDPDCSCAWHGSRAEIRTEIRRRPR
jgi:hypothetical protein